MLAFTTTCTDQHTAGRDRTTSCSTRPRRVGTHTAHIDRHNICPVYPQSPDTVLHDGWFRCVANSRGRRRDAWLATSRRSVADCRPAAPTAADTHRRTAGRASPLVRGDVIRCAASLASLGTPTLIFLRQTIPYRHTIPDIPRALKVCRCNGLPCRADFRTRRSTPHRCVSPIYRRPLSITPFQVCSPTTQNPASVDGDHTCSEASSSAQ